MFALSSDCDILEWWVVKITLFSIPSVVERLNSNSWNTLRNLHASLSVIKCICHNFILSNEYVIRIWLPRLVQLYTKGKVAVGKHGRSSEIQQSIGKWKLLSFWRILHSWTMYGISPSGDMQYCECGQRQETSVGYFCFSKVIHPWLREYLIFWHSRNWYIIFDVNGKEDKEEFDTEWKMEFKKSTIILILKSERMHKNKGWNNIVIGAFNVWKMSLVPLYSFRAIYSNVLYVFRCQ